MLSIHNQYLQRCLQLAALGAGNTAPNPMVGAVLVHNDRILGEGYHRQYGEAHAEVNCLSRVAEADKPLIPDSTLYVSLEPCSHFGKTPPCVDLILKHDIKKVVIGAQDVASHVNGQGIQKLKEHGVEILEYDYQAECVYSNRRFFTFHQKKRPYLILKWAQSADGFIGKTDERVSLSNPITNMLVHKWRSEESAIWVGFKTALLDNPRLNVRHHTGKNPVRIVLDRDLTLPHTHHLFNDDAETIVFNFKRSQQNQNISYVRIDSMNYLEEILQELHARNILSVLVEGGQKLHRELIHAQLYDELRKIETPSFLHQGVKAPSLPENIRCTQNIPVLSDQISIYHPIL
jgi:diaminohydroxyphosphoribosylaminopyrimidine deaminase/5-amino-6-(5-phosphoribosylamino)uracil reductase